VSDFDPGRDLRTHAAPQGLLEGALERADRPREIPRFVFPLAAAALLLLGVRIGMGVDADVPAPPPVTAAEIAEVVPVRLVLHAPEAASVRVAGTFNDWDAETTQMIPANEGTFQATLLLPRGQHEYMFVVDGQWVTDPSATFVRDDGFGNRNAVLEI